MTLATTVEEVLGGKKIPRKKIQSRLDYIELSNKGITKEALLRLADYLGISLHQLAQVLPVTERTIQRYALKKHFNRVVSEQILHLARIAARGSEVFGNRDQFLQWMNMPCRALADKTPLSLIHSKFGSELVLDELGRIEHGVFS